MWQGNTAKISPGHVRNDLVSILDVSATTLRLAGLDLPEYVEGQDLFADDFQPRQFVVTARDRCDYTIDRIRTIRTDRFRYIRNFLTDRPLLQPQYRDDREYAKALRQAHAAGSLEEKIDSIFFGKRPAEELYELESDPHEMNNLADDPSYADELAHHRSLLQAWIKETDDQGQYPESVEGLRSVLKRWKARAVNPEYKPIRKELSTIGPSDKE
jgi:arylsulfatase A-like enzyme